MSESSTERSNRHTGPLRFGVFEAEPSSGELRRNGLKVKLQEQPFQVLMVLLERPGEVVTREELRQRLWPDNTFVDFDHGLNTAINKLRDTLGDKAANPRFIETLPKRGYRFIAPVTGSTAQPPAAPSAVEQVSAAEVQQAAVPQKHEASHLPRTNRGVVRSLFNLIQAMYLIFYLIALYHADGLGGIMRGELATAVMAVIYVSAPLGIAVRLYMMSAVAFDFRGFGSAFLRVFPLLLPLDMLWALSPFLIAHKIGFGLAFAACAALLYVPFSQRTLVRMGY